MRSRFLTRARQGHWWVAAVVLAMVALILSWAVGGYISQLREPVEIGTSEAGEWVDLSEYGLRLRLDSMELAPSFPRSFNESEQMTAPEGTQYLRVRMSIEPTVDEDEYVGCFWKLLNGDGEQLTLTEFGIAGPASTQCSFLEDEGSLEKGVPFASQEVYVVVPKPVESFSLQVNVDTDEGRLYWTFTDSV